jgi:hypothetical protein
MTFRGLPQIKMAENRATNVTANEILDEETGALARAAEGDEGLTGDGIGA